MYAKSALVLCLGLLALGVSARDDDNLRRAFRSGHEYAYNYDGQVVSTLSNADQSAVSRFRCLVKLNFITDKLVNVQLEQPQLGQWNDYFDMPLDFQQFDKFEAVEIKNVHVEKMNLPFQIRLTNGKVSELTFHTDDVTFSENVKRAIVNTLQVQLENPSESDERDAEAYSFALNETTIEGDCESLYTVIKVPSDPESEKLDAYNVTKSVDFSQCRYRPELRYNYYRYAEPAEIVRSNMDEKMAQKMIHSNPALDISSVYEFALNGDRRQFLVKETKVVSKYSYVMVDDELVRMVTYALAKLTLKGVERKEATEQMTSTKTPTSLVYSDAMDVLKERFIAEGDEAYLRQNPYMKMPNAVTVVTNIMKRLLETSTQKSVEGIDEHATRYLTQLVSILRLCSRSDIQTIHQTLFDSTTYNENEKAFIQSILADAMAISGTKITLDHLFKKIEDGEISSMKASSTLTKLMNLRIVSTETVKNLYNLCQKSKVQESTMLKRTCMLTYGAMVNAMCKVDSPYKHSDKYTTASMNKYCDASTKKDIAKDIINWYKQASTRADKILALKTIGNMGLENTVAFLEEIIRDWNIEKIIRIQAIDALRQLRHDMSRRIQLILIPVFQDRREHPEIRINAIYQLLHSRPSKSVLDSIMLEMIRESNPDVKTFVNQLVREMALNADKVYDREIAETLKSMLKRFDLYPRDENEKTFATSKFYSTVVAIDQNQVQELASKLDVAMIFSNDSRLPKELMATWNLLSDKRMTSNAYQVGMHTQGLEELLERLYQTFGSKNFEDIITRGRRSLTDELNPVTFLKNIYNRLNIVTRKVTSTPMILLYSRWQDMDTLFCLTDEDSLPQILQSFIMDGQVDLSIFDKKTWTFNWASASYGYEQQIKTPTITGIPLLTTIRIPTLAILDGTLSTKINGEDENEEKRVHSGRVHLKVEPKVATTTIVKMEMFSPLFTSGIKTFHSAQLRLPLNIVTKVHSPHWMPEIEIMMPTEEVRLIHLQTRPVTFYRTWPEKSGVFIESAEKTLIVESPITPLHERRESYIDLFMGMTVNMDAHWHASPASDKRIIGDWALAGENALEVKIQPTADSAKSLKLSFSALIKLSKNPRRMEIPDFSTLFGSYTEQMFAGAEKDEMKLIKDQIRLAADNLDRFSHFTFKAEAIKGSHPRAASLEVMTVCDQKITLCISNTEVKLDSEWFFKSILQLAMPELRGVVAGFPSQHIIATLDAGFGNDKQNQMILNFYGRPSAEKIETFKLLLNKKESKSSDVELLTMAPKNLKPNDFVMIVENKLAPEWNRMMKTFYNYLSFSPYVTMPDREILEEETSKQSHVLMTRLTLDATCSNLTISMPNKEQLKLNMHQIAQSSNSKAKSLYDVLRRSHNDDAQCSIKKARYVRTFDGKKFKLPMKSCYTILSKDCVQDPSFVIMAKKTGRYVDTLQLKLVTKAKSYELYKSNDKMIVSVDNYVISEKDYEENGVYKVADREGVYEIRCSKTGAVVRFDGVNIKIQIGNKYMNRQCGICGHFNGDGSDDLRKSDNEEADNLQDFHESYIYRETKCTADDSSEEKKDDDYSMDDGESQENQENIV